MIFPFPSFFKELEYIYIYIAPYLINIYREIFMSVCDAVAAPPADRIGWKATELVEEVTACFSLQLFHAL